VKRQQSRSDVQQAAEVAALRQLNQMLGLALEPEKLTLDGASVHLDGYVRTDDTIVLAEIWAHVGPAKSAQRHKVLADVLKLAFVAQTLRQQQPRCVVRSCIVFIDEAAARVLRNRSWAAGAARAMGIETIVVAVAPSLIAEIKAAQRGQDIRNLPDDLSALPDSVDGP
jgi:hypothetical protein